jgi:hypothetical protein
MGIAGRNARCKFGYFWALQKEEKKIRKLAALVITFEDELLAMFSTTLLIDTVR